MHRPCFPSLTLLLMLMATTAIGQQTPSNIYLFKMRVFQDSLYELSEPRFLTLFNQKGYNNHPDFFSETELYISARLPEQEQPDLYLLDLQNRTKTLVTKTEEGEYSPHPMPDENFFSAVRMEYTPMDTLIRLWQFPRDRTSPGKPVFKYLNGIGYYAWMNSRQIAAFRLGEPPYLSIIDVSTDEEQRVASNVGRCLQRLPNGNVVFLQNTTFGQPYLMEYNPFNGQSARIVDALPGSQDFVVMPDGTLLMGQGSKLYKFNKIRDSYWVEIADLSFYQINKITRLAVSPALQLAVVTE